VFCLSWAVGCKVEKRLRYGKSDKAASIHYKIPTRAEYKTFILEFPTLFCKIFSPVITETKTLSRGIIWSSVYQTVIQQNGPSIKRINELSLIASETHRNSKYDYLYEADKLYVTYIQLSFSKSVFFFFRFNVVRLSYCISRTGSGSRPTDSEGLFHLTLPIPDRLVKA
jgi:hypothetical protein